MQGNASRGGGSTVRNKDYRRPLFNKSIWELNIAKYKTRLHSKLMLFTCCVTTYRNGPERTETDLRKYRNGLLWVPKRTGTDFSGYRNGPEQTSAHTETSFNGNQKK